MNEQGQLTFDLFSTLGVFQNLKTVGIRYDNHNSQWEVWGHFQDDNGRRNNRLATFTDVDDAVTFERLCQETCR